MQTAIYCRISHDPRGESLGVTRQLEDCTALAEQAGWTVAEVYTDNDVSATSGNPRPEYDRMLADVVAGRIGAIIAWHPDRLYRRLRDLLDLTDLIEQHATKIRTVRAGDVDLSTPTGQMVAQILGAVSQNEGKVKSDRWKRSWRQRRELGRVTPSGWRCFGYTREGDIVPVEAERLRRIADDVLAGKGLRTICTELNAEGIPTTRGGKWEGNGLRKLLRNPRIAGYATQGYWEPYVGDDGKEHRRRLTEIVGEGEWEPILDRDTWRTICALLVARSTPHNPSRWLLAGLLTCGACGTTLLARKGRSYHAYVCLSSLGGCGQVNIHAEKTDLLIETYVQEKLADPRWRQRHAELRSGDNGHVLAELEALQVRLAEIEEQMAEPGRSMTALVRASDAVRDRIDALQAELTTAHPVRLPEPGDEWPTDLGQRRRLVAIVAPGIVVDPAPGRGRFYPERVRVEGI